MFIQFYCHVPIWLIILTKHQDYKLCLRPFAEERSHATKHLFYRQETSQSLIFDLKKSTDSSFEMTGRVVCEIIIYGNYKEQTQLDLSSWRPVCLSIVWTISREERSHPEFILSKVEEENYLSSERDFSVAQVLPKQKTNTWSFEMTGRVVFEILNKKFDGSFEMTSELGLNSK